MTTLPEVLPGTIISTFLPRWAGRNLSQRQKAPSVTHTCIHTHTSLPRSLVIKGFRSDANLFINTDNDRLYRGRFERVGSVPPAARQLFGIMIFPFSSFQFFLPIPSPYEYFFLFFLQYNCREPLPLLLPQLLFFLTILIIIFTIP